MFRHNRVSQQPNSATDCEYDLVEVIWHRKLQFRCIKRANADHIRYGRTRHIKCIFAAISLECLHKKLLILMNNKLVVCVHIFAHSISSFPPWSSPCSYRWQTHCKWKMFAHLQSSEMDLKLVQFLNYGKIKTIHPSDERLISKGKMDS